MALPHDPQEFPAALGNALHNLRGLDGEGVTADELLEAVLGVADLLAGRRREFGAPVPTSPVAGLHEASVPLSPDDYAAFAPPPVAAPVKYTVGGVGAGAGGGGASLTDEQVQDICGAMFSGNTETRISATYDDDDGTIDLVVDDMTANTQLSQEQVEDYVGGMLDGDETFITVAYDDTDGNIDFTVPVKDEDAMGSDSATHLATQQSIKAYIDSKAPSLVWEHFISWHGNTAAFTSGGAIAGKNVSVHDSSDHDEAVVMYNFTTGNHRGMAWNWVVPADLDVGEVVSAQIYFRVSGAVDQTSNSTVYWGIEANVVADNEATATGGTKFSDTGTLDLSAGSHASGDLAVLDMGTQFGASTLVVGDYVRGVVWRDGTNAADNFGSTCQHIGIRFIGTKATA